MAADNEAFPEYNNNPEARSGFSVEPSLGHAALERFQLNGDVSVDSLRRQEAVALFGAYLEEARTDPSNRVLYEHQVPVMEDLYTFVLTHTEDTRGYISLPTGTGKTVLFTEFIKATGLRTLVVEPTKLLLTQTERAFGKFESDNDVTIGKVFANEKDNSQHVTITTYASLVRQMNNGYASKIKPEDYDLLILDEAHRAMGEQTVKALEHFSHAIQIGMTATENYSVNRQLKSLLPHEIHKMSIREAVEFGLITPFSNWVVQTETDMSGVPINQSNDYDIETLQRTVNNSVRNQLAVDIYRTYFDGQKVIYFCAGVKHAKYMADSLRQHGVSAQAIHGGQSLKVQEAIKDHFSSKDGETRIDVLCNDKILAEGFDEVGIAACFNLAPTLSYVRAQQRSGRTLRLDPSAPNKHAYIVDFVDKNYRKPPILFADTLVAGTAQLGITGQENLNINVTYNVGTGVVIRDPEAVELMADSFSAARHVKRENAPEGWMTISAIANRYNVNVQQAKIVMGKLIEWGEELIDSDVGRYSSRGVEDGITTYYSPNVQEGFGAVLDTILPNRLRVAPEGWLSSTQIAALNDEHGKDIRPKLHAFAEGQDDQTGIYKLPLPASGSRRQFYSEHIVKSYMLYNGREDFDITTPQPNWQNEEQIITNLDTELGNEVFAEFKSAYRDIYYSQTIMYGSERFVAPRMFDHLRQYLKPHKDWVTTEAYAAQSGHDEELVKIVIADLKLGQPELTAYDSKYGMNENKIDRYYSQRFFNFVTRYIEKHPELAAKPVSEADDPILMVEDTQITVPQVEIISGLALPVITGQKDSIDFSSRNQKHTKLAGSTSRRTAAPILVIKKKRLPSVANEPIVNVKAHDSAVRSIRPEVIVKQALSRADVLRKYRR